MRRKTKRPSSSNDILDVKRQKLEQGKSKRRPKRLESHVLTRYANVSSFYGHTTILRKLLDSIGAFNAKGLLGNESPELKRFLDTTLVGVESSDSVRAFLRSKLGVYLDEENPSQRDLIQHVIEDIFKIARYPEHVLTFGFEISESSINFATGIDMVHFNSQTEALHSKVWLELRELTSPSVLYYLWAKAALFIPIPAHSLLQITGFVISARQKNEDQKLLTNSKSTPVPSCIAMKRASEVSIRKLAVIYATPFFYSRERKVRHGFRPQRKDNSELLCFLF